MLDLDKIIELSTGVDEALRRALSFTEYLKDVKVSLDNLRNSAESKMIYEVQKLRDEVSALRQQLRHTGGTNISQYEIEFEEMRRLVESEEWPVAVDPAAICSTPEKQSFRAQNILEMIV